MKNKGFTTTNKKPQGGFTLIELMIVISMISLLSTTTFYASTDAKEKAEDAHMKVEADQVKKAILIRKASGGNAPLYAQSGLTGTFHQEGSDEYELAMNELVPEYLSEVPTSPDGDAYWYAVSDDGQAVFAADLNGDYFNDSYNSCEIIESNPVEVCSTTDPVVVCTEEVPPEISCEITPGIEVCPGGDGGCYTEPPTEICTVIPGTDSECEEFPGTTSCETVYEDFICDGSSGSEYCSCIE
jgi:prepilin-type N-terminal cleavage/methylation domain-containing protein